MLDRLKAYLLAHGTPQIVVDKIAVMESKGLEIVMIFYHDGKDAAVQFIDSEYEKIKGMLTS